MADQSSITLERARDALVARDFAFAEKLVQNLIRQEGERGDFLEVLGSVYLRSDQYEKALGIFP